MVEASLQHVALFIARQHSERFRQRMTVNLAMCDGPQELRLESPAKRLAQAAVQFRDRWSSKLCRRRGRGKIRLSSVAMNVSCDCRSAAIARGALQRCYCDTRARLLRVLLGMPGSRRPRRHPALSGACSVEDAHVRAPRDALHFAEEDPALFPETRVD